MNYGHTLLNHPLLGAAFAGVTPGPGPAMLGFIPAAVFTIILILAAVWSLIWKGIALWHAARNRQTVWFVVLVIFNTLGILEIVYLIWFRRDQNTTVLEKTVVSTVQVAPPTNPDSEAKS